LSGIAPLARYEVGVVVERSKGESQWVDFHWRPVTILIGAPDTPLWTKLTDDGERATFYVGAAAVELYLTETAHYRDNLQMDPPQLWVVLRPVERDPPYELAMVTADPAEGEGMTEAGNNIVEPLPMPEQLQDAVAAFVAEHHVERTFVKRKRDRADPDALARRGLSTRDDRK
jgi:hypothetical protein